MDELTHECPGFVIYIQFWVTRNGKELTGIGSGFTVMNMDSRGFQSFVVISNDQQSALTAAPVTRASALSHWLRDSKCHQQENKRESLSPCSAAPAP